MSRRIAIFCVLLALVSPVKGQDALSLSDSETTVRDLSFRFPGTSTFENDRLIQEMATEAPQFLDNLRRRLDFIPFISARAFIFNPIELQRDVIRLRRFYERNGFPHARVDYPASQYRQSDNTIHVIMTIVEGAPTRLDSVRVTLESPIYEGLQSQWDKVVSNIHDRIGNRYTEFERLQMENDALNLLQNRGYAFARVESVTKPGTADETVIIDIRAIPGPLTTVGDIEIVGLETVERNIVIRELPFSSGDRYSRKKFFQGQQELFGLGLFRLALAEIPEQTPDSTVDLRYVVREAKPRFIVVETGYSAEVGLSFDSNLRHRNFFGGARQMTAAMAINSGLLASPAGNRRAVRSFEGSLSLRQPYLGTTRLSGSMAPFYTWQDDPNLDTRFYKIGLTTGLLYDMLPFRTISLQHTLERTIPLLGNDFTSRLDIYDISVLSLGATIGKVNNFLNPKRGLLFRPLLEMGGLIGPTGVDYIKGKIDMVAYVPITTRTSAVLALTVGTMTPRGNSSDQVAANNEFRFDAIRFYAGGSSDVRGWALNALGPQIALADSVVQQSDGTFKASNARFEAIGGQSKFSGSLEYRFPAPWLGSSWSLGAFLDGAVLSSTITTDSGARPILTAEDLPLFTDDGTISVRDMQFGTGMGIRYQTPVGLMRFDLAYKLNPSDEDLRSANDLFLFQSGVSDSIGKERSLRRFNFQLSIERTF